MQPQGLPYPGDSTWGETWLEVNHVQEKASAGQQERGHGQLLLRLGLGELW